MKRSYKYISLFLLALSLLIYIVCPQRQSSQLRALALAETSQSYALPVAGDTLYLSLDGNAVSLSFDSIAQKALVAATRVSPEGHYLLPDTALRTAVADTLKGNALQKRLAQTATQVDSLKQRYEKECRTLDRYASRHTVVDDGYNEVMAYRAEAHEKLSHLDTMAVLLKRAVAESQPAVRCGSYRIIANEALGESADSIVQCATTARECGRAGRFVVVQTAVSTAAPWIHLGSFTLFSSPSAERLAFAHYAQATTRALPMPTADSTVLDGALAENAFGRVCAVKMGEENVALDEARDAMSASQSAWRWGWTYVKGSVVRWWRLLFGDEAKDKVKYLRTAETARSLAFTVGDTARYFGQTAPETLQGQKGRHVREGWGMLTLNDGTIYEGRWHADTLEEGSRRTVTSTYRGTFNAQLQLHGNGRMDKNSGEVYSGAWNADRREGLGFSVDGDRIVRCGSWKNGNFRGERTVYTADRVYGIDISRYQHEIGRKRYAINWSQLRITSLGEGRRVSGAVNYPVSFVYIKSTEGTSVLNRYYAADLRDARKHGVHAGTYHFFSTTTPGQKQAAWFLKNSQVASSDLPPVLDIEPTDGQIRQMGGDSILFREVAAWVRSVEARTGRKVILYVSQMFINNHLINAPQWLRERDVWIARYSEYKPYVHLLHWQLTPYGRVRGIHGEVDINLFNGTKAQWADYLHE